MVQRLCFLLLGLKEVLPYRCVHLEYSDQGEREKGRKKGKRNIQELLDDNGAHFESLIEYPLLTHTSSQAAAHLEPKHRILSWRESGVQIRKLMNKWPSVEPKDTGTA